MRRMLKGFADSYGLPDFTGREQACDMAVLLHVLTERFRPAQILTGHGFTSPFRSGTASVRPCGS